MGWPGPSIYTPQRIYPCKLTGIPPWKTTPSLPTLQPGRLALKRLTSRQLDQGVMSPQHKRAYDEPESWREIHVSACTQEFNLIHYARAFYIDYNSSLGGPSGGVSLSASMLFTCTRNSSTLERGIKYQAFVNNLWNNLIVSEWLLLPAQPSRGGTETIRRSPRHIPGEKDTLAHHWKRHIPSKRFIVSGFFVIFTFQGLIKSWYKCSISL